ncbi:DUF3622 domain-containing protein [Vibrio breoganii]|nr:DUF3622 domain-containing protein [Vibrio breoganii]TKG14629.1 DUF3622 domain-containing protein [Vibrio breoganii]TKG29308.1 DUF3622 domain-containing protein [Vibrio breoganii]
MPSIVFNQASLCWQYAWEERFNPSNEKIFRELHMSDSKKFTVRTIEKRNGWCAEIVRQVTSRRTTVSKREMGFETEAQAQAWGEKELEGFVKTQVERNKRKAADRKSED